MRGTVENMASPPRIGWCPMTLDHTVERAALMALTLGSAELNRFDSLTSSSS
jgi:hypothetical protein